MGSIPSYHSGKQPANEPRRKPLQERGKALRSADEDHGFPQAYGPDSPTSKRAGRHGRAVLIIHGTEPLTIASHGVEADVRFDISSAQESQADTGLI